MCVCVCVYIKGLSAVFFSFDLIISFFWLTLYSFLFLIWILFFAAGKLLSACCCGVTDHHGNSVDVLSVRLWESGWAVLWGADCGGRADCL